MSKGHINTKGTYGRTIISSKEPSKHRVIERATYEACNRSCRGICATAKGAWQTTRAAYRSWRAI